MQQINDNLKNLTKQQLEAEWRKYFKTDAPQRARSEFLRKHINWQQHCKQYGGLSSKAKNQLQRLMDDLRAGKELAPLSNLSIKSGTKLLREYKGKKHEVIIDGESYIYKGVAYKSLSRIARLITGTQWNGKLFFGVK